MKSLDRNTLNVFTWSSRTNFVVKHTHTIAGTPAGTTIRIILGDPAAAALDFRSHGRHGHERNNFSPCTTRHTYIL